LTFYGCKNSANLESYCIAVDGAKIARFGGRSPNCQRPTAWASAEGGRGPWPPGFLYI